MTHWTQEEAEKRGLLPICGTVLNRADGGNYQACEEALREALSGESLRRSLVFLEKERVLRELRAAVAAAGNERASQALEFAIKSIKEI